MASFMPFSSPSAVEKLDYNNELELEGGGGATRTAAVEEEEKGGY